MKILIIRLGRIGDMILTTPMIKVIKRNYPNAEIHFIAGRQNHQVLKYHPDVTNIFVHKKTPLKLIANIIGIRKNNYDFYIDSKDHPSTESSLFARIVRARLKVGFNNKGKKIFDISIPAGSRQSRIHYIDICMQSLDLAGMETSGGNVRPELFLSGDSERYAVEFISRLPQLRVNIVLNISAGSSDRIWDNSKWAEVLSHVDSDKYNVILLFAPAEKDIAASLANLCPRLHAFNSMSLSDAFALVKACDGLMTPDTALVHAASAFDTPLLVLYSSSDFFTSRFYPMSSVKVIVRSDKTDSKINRIGPKEVIEAFKRFEKLLIADK